MTTLQCQQVCSDLIAAGYTPSVQQLTANNWTVSASTQSVVTLNQAQTFANNHGVAMETYQVSSYVTFA